MLVYACRKKIVKDNLTKPEIQEKQKTRLFDIFRRRQKSVNDNHHDEQKTAEKTEEKAKQKTEEKTEQIIESKTKDKKDENITFSFFDFNKILTRFVFLEDHLSRYEDIQTFNFNTFKCTKSKKKEENFFIDDEIESHQEILEELKESENYIFYKIVDKRNYSIMLKKVLKPEEKIQFKDLQNTIKEFEVLHQINHPCICKTFGMNIQEGFGDLKTIAIFLEFLDFDLKMCLDKNILSNSMKVKIAVEVASGMSYLHKHGMIHRDLNIDNIMLNRFFEAKIINFGQVFVLNAIQNESISLTKNIGDLAFMSPEMLNDDDDKDYDNKTDIYSFGVILYKLFTGNLPNISIKDRIKKVLPVFPHPTPSVSECCIELIKMCMQYEPSQRPSFDEILDFMKQHSFALAANVDTKLIFQRYQSLNQID